MIQSLVKLELDDSLILKVLDNDAKVQSAKGKVYVSPIDKEVLSSWLKETNSGLAYDVISLTYGNIGDVGTVFHWDPTFS